MINNFLTGLVSGSATSYYRNIHQEFTLLKSKETDVHVKLWIDEYLDAIEFHIRLSRDLEEREDNI